MVTTRGWIRAVVILGSERVWTTPDGCVPHPFWSGHAAVGPDLDRDGHVHVARVDQGRMSQGYPRNMARHAAVGPDLECLWE